MAIVECLCLLVILLNFKITSGLNTSMLIQLHSICDDKLMDFDKTKNYLHTILLSLLNESSMHNTNEVYSTKLCPLNNNSKYYLCIDYNSSCAYISFDIDIIWKKCISDTNNHSMIHHISQSNSRSLLSTSNPTVEPTIEPTQEPITTFYPTTEPTIYSTFPETEESKFDKLIEFWYQYKTWIILGLVLFVIIILALIYFLCVTYSCCCPAQHKKFSSRKRLKQRNINSTSRKTKNSFSNNGALRETDRNSYENVGSSGDDVYNRNTELIPIIHKPDNEQNEDLKNKTNEIKYKQVATEISGHMSDEKEFMLNYSDDSDSSEMFRTNTKQIANDATMTAQFQNDNTDIGSIISEQTISKSNRDQQIVINIHHNHFSNSSLHDMILPVTSSPIHDNNIDEELPVNLPNLPNEILDTDTDVVGEGFDINAWIMQTLKECAPENDEWKEYWSNFRKHKITENILITLITDKHNKHEEWKELIPIIGPRIRFQQEWEKELLRQQQKHIR